MSQEPQPSSNCRCNACGATLEKGQSCGQACKIAARREFFRILLFGWLFSLGVGFVFGPFIVFASNASNEVPRPWTSLIGLAIAAGMTFSLMGVADCFDFTQTPRPQGIYTGGALSGVEWGSGVHARLTSQRGLLEALLEHIFVLPELRALDRRASTFEALWEAERLTTSLRRMNG
jgi:hypothetical protein